MSCCITIPQYSVRITVYLDNRTNIKFLDKDTMFIMLELSEIVQILNNNGKEQIPICKEAVLTLSDQSINALFEASKTKEHVWEFIRVRQAY